MVDEDKPEISVHNLFMLEAISAFADHFYEHVASSGSDAKMTKLFFVYKGVEIEINYSQEKWPEDGKYYKVEDGH